MPDYKNGKIYKITSKNTDLIYIGSTTTKLCQRMTKHRSEAKTKTNNTTSSIIIEAGDACITLIEDYPCERIEQLLMRERYHIENVKCVNKVLPLKTEEEHKTISQEYTAKYRAEHPETIRNYNLKYKAEHKEEAKSYQADYYPTYAAENKAKLTAYKSEWRRKDKAKKLALKNKPLEKND